jgi:hypothetical protein
MEAGEPWFSCLAPFLSGDPLMGLKTMRCSGRARVVVNGWVLASSTSFRAAPLPLRAVDAAASPHIRANRIEAA